MRFLYNCVNRYKSASFRTPNQTNLSNPKRKARTPSNLTSLRSTHPSRRLARYIPRLAPRREIYIFGRFSEKARARAYIRTYSRASSKRRSASVFRRVRKCIRMLAKDADDGRWNVSGLFGYQELFREARAHMFERKKH